MLLTLLNRNIGTAKILTTFEIPFIDCLLQNYFQLEHNHIIQSHLLLKNFFVFRKWEITK